MDTLVSKEETPMTPSKFVTKKSLVNSSMDIAVAKKFSTALNVNDYENPVKAFISTKNQATEYDLKFNKIMEMYNMQKGI